MLEPKSISLSFSLAQAATVAALGTAPSVSYASESPTAHVHPSASMDPDGRIIALVEAKVELGLAQQKVELKVTAQKVDDLKARFDDLSSRMSTVPSDIAAMKRDIAHLPSKDDLSTRLRNQLLSFLGIGGLLGTAIGVGFRFAGQ